MTSAINNKTTVMIGAGSAIAQATIRQILDNDDETDVIAISRQRAPGDFLRSNRLMWLTSDYSQHSIKTLIALLIKKQVDIHRVCICLGVLHNEYLTPEKRLEDLDAEAMHTAYYINAVLPVLWLQSLLALMPRNHHCAIAVLSARIGSIADNDLGGWYSYRASKAALNMLLKTASIEYTRRLPNVKIIAFHPGTTDTPLSKPFQKNVPKEKLYSPQFVARRLLDIMDSTTNDNSIAYIDWDNKPISW